MGHLPLKVPNSPSLEQDVLPPPYHQTNHSPFIVTETTTTRTEVVTTTETTTHFVSLTGWGKRNNVNDIMLRRPHYSGNTEDGGPPLRTSFIQCDKALPPTPSDTSAHQAPSNRNAHTTENTSPPSGGPSGTSHGSRYPQVTSLAPSSSSPSQMNTTAFTATASPPQAVRRIKSSHRLEMSPAALHPEGGTSQRTRRLSLGPTALLKFGTADTKSKADAPKTLSRKRSFWTRKRPDDPTQRARPSTAHGNTSHSLASMELNFPPPNIRQLKRQAHDLLPSSTAQQSLYQPTESEVPVSMTSNFKSQATRSPMVPSIVPGQTSFINPPVPGSRRMASVNVPEKTVNMNLPVPRVRSQSSSPLLHRLSFNMFSSSPAIPTSTLSPTSPLLGPTSEPIRKTVVVPRPVDDREPPDVYVGRLMDAVSKVEIVNTLASSAEPFYVSALKIFFECFDFVGDPLDIALRKLLLEVGLPKETQQIDRVIEAFANRYIRCNPSLYLSEDHPYILAFSLIMLHTDAFNKSNRRKMTKPDYLKNTRLPGVAPEILDYLYDNIVFAPFIFIEDPLDVNSKHDPGTESNRRSSAFRDLPSTSLPHSPTGTMLAIKSNKIDLYYMISNNLLGPLRIDVGNYIPLSSPYNYEGTAGKWDQEKLLLSFVNAHVVEVKSDATRSVPFFGLAPIPPVSMSVDDNVHPKPSALRVTKAGLMNRKDLGGGKKPIGRKWKSWGVLLTGSQLLFSRDPTWLNTLSNRTETDKVRFPIPQSEILKVEESLSLKNAVAVHDKSYLKHRFTFRLVLSDGPQFLLKASNENDMNQWISRINYASAFKSAGVHMRLTSISGRSMQLTGVAAATFHLHDIQNQMHPPPSDPAAWDDDATHQLLQMLSGEDPAHKQMHRQRKMTLRTNRKVELEAPIPPEIEKTPEFKDTFDQVKADLAAESWANSNKDSRSINIPTLMISTADAISSSPDLPSQTSSPTSYPRQLSRAQIIEARLMELDGRLTAMKEHLDVHMRFVRNVATLMPFQKATRDRLLAAIQANAIVIMQMRLDMARMSCHRSVLFNDMVAETRIWKEVKNVALQAAKETLQRRDPEDMHTVLHNGGAPPGGALQALSRQGSESSVCESFHTAIDFGPDWPSSDDLGSSLLTTSLMFGSSRPSSSGSVSSHLWLEEDKNVEPVDNGVSGIKHANGQHERFYTAQEYPVEEAEDWNKTRCAKRVSLVKIPSNLESLPVNKRLAGSLSTTKQIVEC